jgi:pilus assembly protein CpaE
VILDLSKSFRPTDFAALRAADLVLLVGQLELTSIRNIVRLQMSMGNIEGLADKVQVVLNRVGSEEQEITLKKAEETIGRPVYWQIPNDSRSVMGSRNAGVPLIQHAPKSKICQNLLALANALSVREPAVAPSNGQHPKKEKKGFRLFSQR